MQPPPRAEQLSQTYVLESAVWQLAIPLIFNLRDLTRSCVVEDIHLTGDSLLHMDAFDDISCFQIHADRITARSHFVV